MTRLQMVIDLAEAAAPGWVTNADVKTACGCTSGGAQVTLLALEKKGELHRVKRRWPDDRMRWFRRAEDAERCRADPQAGRPTSARASFAPVGSAAHALLLGDGWSREVAP